MSGDKLPKNEEYVNPLLRRGGHKQGDKLPKNEEYVNRIIARAKELKVLDAFAAPKRQVGMAVSAAQAKATTAMHARNSRRITVAFVVALIVVILVSLCLPYRGVNVMGGAGSHYSPTEVLAGYALWFRLNVMTLFDSSLASQNTAEINNFAALYGAEAYTYIINRVVITFLVILCGIMLALAGALFQTTFRNPIAAPTMLGASDGVTLGGVVYTMLGYEVAASNPGLYAILVYGCGALTVAVVMLLSRVMSGGKRYSVLDMLLLGTVICQLVGGINQFVQYFVMTDDQWDNFYNIQQATDALTEPVLQVVAIVLFVVTFFFAFRLRFKFNLVAFSDEEATLMGIRPGVLRTVALVLGSAMVLAAMATVGQVAMLSLAVPFLVRYLFPADFRIQFLGNCLVGSLILLVCMVFQHFIVAGFITLPLGTIVSVIIVPFFVWVVALSQGRWN